jgi:hypothetical protein
MGTGTGTGTDVRRSKCWVFLFRKIKPPPIASPSLGVILFWAYMCCLIIFYGVGIGGGFIFRGKIHPTLRLAHVGTGTGTRYPASVPLSYRYCESFNPRRFVRIRRRDVFRKKQLCRSWRHECLIELMVLFIVYEVLHVSVCLKCVWFAALGFSA